MPTIFPLPPPPIPKPIPIIIPPKHLPHIRLHLILALLRALRHRLLQILGPLRMRPHLALRPIRTKPREIVRAQLPPHVLLRAQRAQRTKAHIVVRTRRQLRQRIDVQIQTLLAVGAVPVAHEEVALGHLTQVVLVQKLALLALLAQAAQPVLAHQRVEPARRMLLLLLRRAVLGAAVRDVALGAARAVGAAARLEGSAYRAVGGEADLVRLAEEWREVEAVGMRGVVEDGGHGVSGRGRGGCCCGHGGRFVFGRLAWAETPGMRCLQLNNELSIDLVGSEKQYPDSEFSGGR